MQASQSNNPKSKYSHGYVTIRTVSATEMPCNALGIKSNAYIEMKIGSWIKKSGISSINSKGVWNGPYSTPQLPTPQMEKEGIKMKIMSSSLLGGESDAVIAQSTIPLAQLLSQPNEWVDINGQLALDNKYSGKFSVSGMFLSPDSSVPLDRSEKEDKIKSDIKKTSPKVLVPVSVPVPAAVPAPAPAPKVIVAAPAAKVIESCVGGSIQSMDETAIPSSSSSASASSSSSSSSSNNPVGKALDSVENKGGGRGGVVGDDVISSDKLDKLNGMFLGVQKQTLDLQNKVGGLEKGITTQLNQVMKKLYDFCCIIFVILFLS